MYPCIYTRMHLQANTQKNKQQWKKKKKDNTEK